jgi:uncharacterized protein YegL
MSAFQFKSTSTKTTSKVMKQSGGQKSQQSDSSKKSSPNNQVMKNKSKANTTSSGQVVKHNSAKTSYGVTQSKTVVTTQEILGVSAQSQRKKLVFGWIQDVSGSMSGSRINTSLEGFQFMFNEVYHPNDFLSVVTFCEEVKTLHKPMVVKKIDAEKDMGNIRNNMGGRTACYDAVASSIQGLQAMVRDENYSAVTQDAVYQLLLVTDGQDNSSTAFTLTRLIELVERPGVPNFHFFVVAVSMTNEDKKNLKKLCKSSHTTFIDVADIGELQKTFQRVAKSVQQRLVVTTTVTETRVVSGSTNAKIDLSALNAKQITAHHKVASLPAPNFSQPKVNQQVKKENQKSIICNFFSQKGGCRNGILCKFQHI